MEPTHTSRASNAIPAGHDHDSWAAWEQYRQNRGGDRVFFWDFLEENPALYDLDAEDAGSQATPPVDAASDEWASIPEHVIAALPRTLNGIPERSAPICDGIPQEFPKAG